MASLDRSIQLLVAMADAYAVPHPRTGGREPLMVFRAGGGPHLQHHAFDASDWPDVDEQMIEELAGNGLLRLDYSGSGTIQVHVTQEGATLAAEAKRILEGDQSTDVEPVELDWEKVGEPTLRAAYRTWLSKGAPQNGILSTDIVGRLENEIDERSAIRAIDMLADAGYLAPTSMLGTDLGPPLVAVTARGLEAVGGWPATTADAAAKALLAALDREIDEADEGEEKTKLMRLREVMLDVGQGAITDVLRHVLTSGL